MKIKKNIKHSLNLLINPKIKNTSGFAILFAVLTASLLLMVGLSIFNISIKELVISGFNTESKKAMYAAQSGIECFFYWKPQKFNIGSSGIFEDTNSKIPINCGAGSFSDTDGVVISEQLDSGDHKIFWFSLSSSTPDISDPCVKVEVKKMSDTATEHNISVDSTGYNTCDLEYNDRVVEKSFHLDVSILIPQSTTP